jgi:predicted HicB family RNase H-like nuclease
LEVPVLKKAPVQSPQAPQRRDVVFTAYLPPALHDALTRAAAREMISMSGYARKAIALSLREDGLLPDIR